VPAAVTEAVAAGGTPKAGPAAAVLPPAAGTKSLVEKACGTSCHSMDVLAGQRTDAKGWNAIVQNMVARGAQASDAQVKAIVEYLAKNYGR
jgi:competence protein ComEA